METYDLNPENYDFRWQMPIEQHTDSIIIGTIFDIKVLVFDGDRKYIVKLENTTLFIEGIFVPYQFGHDNSLNVICYMLQGLTIEDLNFVNTINNVIGELNLTIQISPIAPMRDSGLMVKQQELLDDYRSDIYGDINEEYVELNNLQFWHNYFEFDQNSDNYQPQPYELPQPGTYRTYYKTIYNPEDDNVKAYTGKLKMTPKTLESASRVMSLYVDRAIELVLINKSLPMTILTNFNYFKDLINKQLMYAFNLNYEKENSVGNTYLSFAKQQIGWKNDDLAAAIRNSGVVKMKPDATVVSNNVMTDNNEHSTKSVILYKGNTIDIAKYQRGIYNNSFIQERWQKLYGPDVYTEILLKDLGIDRDGHFPITVFRTLNYNPTQCYEFVCRRLFRSYLYIDWQDMININLADESLARNFYKLTVGTTAANLQISIADIQQQFNTIIQQAKQNNLSLNAWINQRPVFDII